MSNPLAAANAFQRLRLATQARIALGRAGNGLPTTPLLDFQMAHAMARDAVHSPLSSGAIEAGLSAEPISVSSRAPTRQCYLQRPDLGRRLDGESVEKLDALHRPNCDAVIIIADGLSATAVHRHGASVAMALQARLSSWQFAPIVVAHQARVALADEIGAHLNAMLSVILIGERPGLSASDSLGAYITWRPHLGRMDSERNCVSNIRPPHGLSHAEAADKIAWLMQQARMLQLTGTALKEEQRSSLSQITTASQGQP